jgi:hypothetical protein
MTAQIAVLLPMPSARVRAATAVNAEFLASSLGRRGKREWPTCYGQKEGNHSPFPNLHPGAHATLVPPAGWHLTSCPASSYAVGVRNAGRSFRSPVGWRNPTGGHIVRR